MSNEMISVPCELLERALSILALSPSTLYSELRALLAKPAEERGSSHGFEQSPNTCRHDERAGVWWREGSITRTGRECCACGSVEEDPLKPAARQRGNAVAAKVCAYTPGMGQVELKLPGALPQWLELGEVVTVLHGGTQPQGEPVYQLRNNVLATNWRDADKAAYDSVGDNPSYERRVLYNHPAEQPVLASDQWPKLEKPALVGAGRFSIGLSARLVVEAAQRHYEYETTPENETLRIATGDNFLALLAQLEQLRGLHPAVPPRPPEGNGLPRYGLRWNGPQQPLATPMDDGYWTPWHLANELRKDGERYRWLRSRDLETINQGGVFAGITPQNMVLNEETLDEAIDAAMAKEVQP